VSDGEHDIEHDVVVIGDGPAGSALAKACVDASIDVVLVGDDQPWDATYGAWADDVAAVDLLGGHDVFATAPTPVAVWTDRRHDLRRDYAQLDNARLRDILRAGVRTHAGVVARVVVGTDRHTVELVGGGTVRCRLVVDSSGWPASFAGKTIGQRPTAWQTAFGVVLPEPPPGDLGQPTLMDFRLPPRTVPQVPSAAAAGQPGKQRRATTFAYSLPVDGGWLVEETVLTARPAIEPVALVSVLAARLQLDPDVMLDRAVRTEYVRIPMGGSRPRRDQPTVAFGAAAGYVNPTSGYSVVHSMAMAPSVAEAIRTSLTTSGNTNVAAPLPVWNAVWPAAHRRTRELHDYGLDMMLRLDADSISEFFGTFFDLPTDQWSAYMRSATAPVEVSGVMARLFKKASWSTRRQLVAGNPSMFARLIRPS
jgi:lycopene beta-cyclase